MNDQLDKGPRQVRGPFECVRCEVRWLDTQNCWSCGRFGRALMVKVTSEGRDGWPSSYMTMRSALGVRPMMMNPEYRGQGGPDTTDHL